MSRTNGFLRRFPLFYQMLFVLVVTVSIPILALGYLSYERSREQIEEVAYVFLADNVNQNAGRVERLLHDVQQRSETVIASAELQAILASPPPDSISDELDFIRRMNAAIADLSGPYELYIYPVDMEFYPNYNNLLQYHQFAPSEAMFSKAAELQGRGYWMHRWNDRWKAPDFIFIRQIRSLDDFEPVGVMAIRVPHFMFREELIGPSLYPRAELIMTEADGTVLLHPEAAEYGNPILAASEEADYMRASVDLHTEGWALSILLPKADIMATLQNVKRFTIGMVVVSLLFMVVLLLIIARHFTNPIKLIIRYMKKVQLGQLEPLPAQQRYDEIGEWMNGYNMMIESLRMQMDATRNMEREKNELERQMLILQINPHFLYNTLDAIKWKAQSVNEPVISEMVMRLASMFRFSLGEGKDWTTVERELEHVKNYVAIESLRNPGMFRVMYSIEPDLLGERVTRLILQPLVENAVRHGMNKRKDGKGKIMISAFREGRDMVFIVEDNGPGGEPGKPPGIGLSNVERRLTLRFGEAYKIRIEGARPGFKVRLKHPCMTEQPLRMHP